MYKNVDISVLVITYNHGKYLKQCLEGILAQKTKYSFEIIIHDDASPDNTQSIIKEYATNYPDLIIPIIQNTNMYSQGVPLFYQYRHLLRGRYIATCEGDDYWCDDFKLQKQVEFLESHRDYIACYHNVKVIDENDVILPSNKHIYHNRPNQDFSLKDVERFRLPGQSASKVYRNFWMDLDESIIKDYLAIQSNGDQKIVILLFLLGKIYIMNDEMAVHRKIIVGGTSWSARTYGKNRLYELYLSIIEINQFSRKYFQKEIIVKDQRLAIIFGALIKFLKTFTKSDFKIFNKILKINIDSKLDTFTYILIRIISYPIRYFHRLKGL